MRSIAARIAGYSQLLEPLKESAGRYLKYPSVLAEDDVALIGHRPWVAPKNYMFRLYPPVSSDARQHYGQIFGIDVPPVYTDFLREVNGACCFGMSLCGMPQSMLGRPPLLDRTVLQCHDLATAVNHWTRAYCVPGELFHFGYRHYSDDEDVGYFIERCNRIICVKKDGNVLGDWTNFTAFLSDELKASENLEEELNPSNWRAESPHQAS